MNPKKICLIGPGIMPIPPPGWGAVEVLIWDYARYLTKRGHTIKIINTPDRKEILREVENFNPDFTHLHYDVFYDIIPLLCALGSKVVLTSHYPYISNESKYLNDGYTSIFTGILNFSNKLDNFFMGFLCESDMNVFLSKGLDSKKGFILQNGVDPEIFKTKTSNVLNTSKSIFLGKIDSRKRQHLCIGLNNLDFYGPCAYKSFIDACSDTLIPSRYLGELSRDKVPVVLNDYHNLILLSEDESDPLVVKEALMCGLGVVLSEGASKSIVSILKNRGETVPDFINIVPEHSVKNLDFVQRVLDSNAKLAKGKKLEIRKFAVSHFSWDVVIEEYQKYF